MPGKIGRALRLLFNPRALRALFRFYYNGFSPERGWLRSYITGAPADAAGNPLPWMTYPFISFIGGRLKPEMNIFEYGSGSSTRYFASRVRSITSVEHSREWFENIRRGLPPNARLLFSGSTGEYAGTAAAAGGRYDIVVVDGIDRVACLEQCPAVLSTSGVIILDDAERPEYEPGLRFIAGRGFRRLDFHGIAPCILYEKSTSVLYRPDNCLEI